MSDNNFLVELIAKLNKKRSESQIRQDAKSLGDIFVPLIGKLAKTKTRAQIKQDLSDMSGTIKLDVKVDNKGAVRAVQQTTKQAQKVTDTNPIQINFSVKKDKLINDIKILAQQNSKIFKDVNVSQKYNALLDNAKLATSNAELKTLRLQLNAMRSELKATNLAGLNITDTFKKGLKKATELFGSYGLIMAFTRQLRNAWNEALELDKTFTDLVKVQQELSRGDYPDYLDKCTKKSKELATSQKALMEMATEFSKSGYSLADSDALSELATILANVGNMNPADSAKAIISGIQAYDVVDGYDDVIHKAQALIDKYNEIGNTASITTAEIAEGVQRVGSVFADTGTSVDEFIALLAAGNRQFQDADALSLGLRTAALRIRGCKVELESMGEETDNVVTSTSKLAEKIEALTNISGKGGVKILAEDEKTFRSIYDIFVDIAKVYKEMSAVDQSALLDLIAGKNRASAISATLKNMSEAQEIYQRSLASAGSAQKEYNEYLKSTEASLNRFKASMTETYQSVITGQTAKALIDAGNAALTFANNIGLVEGVLKGLIGIGITKFITTLATAFKATAIQASNFGNALKTVNTMRNLTRDTEEYRNALNSLKLVAGSLSETQLKQVLASKSLSEADRIAILRTTGLTKAQAQAKLAQMGLTQSTKAQSAANKSATASTFSFSAAVKGLGASLKAAFMSNPIGIAIMAISTAISAVSSAISKYNQDIEEARQKTKEMAEKELLKLSEDSYGILPWQYGRNLISTTGKGVVEAFEILERAGLVSSGAYNHTRDPKNGGVFKLSEGDTVEDALENYRKLDEALKALVESNQFTSEELSKNNLYTALQKRKNELEEVVNGYRTAIAELNENVAQELTLVALKGNTLPKTAEEFERFKRQLIDMALASDDFIGKEEDITNAVINYLSTVPEFGAFFRTFGEELDKAAESLQQDRFPKLSSFSEDQVKAIQEYESTLKSATDALKKFYDQSVGAEGITEAEIAKIFNGVGYDFKNLLAGEETISEAVHNIANLAFEKLASEFGDDANSGKVKEQYKAMLDKALNPDFDLQFYVSAFDELNGLLDDVQKGRTWDSEGLGAYIRKYNELSKAVTGTANAFSFEEDTIISLAKTNAETANKMIADRMGVLQAELTAAKATASLINDKISAFNEVAMLGNVGMSDMSYINGLYGDASEINDTVKALNDEYKMLSMLSDKLYEFSIKHNSSKPSTSEIDWISQSISNLEESVEDAEKTFSNTTGLENQLKALKDVNRELEKLAAGYKNASDEYLSRYSKAKDSLSGLDLNGMTVSQVDSAVRGGSRFSLDEFKSETAEVIRGMQDDWKNYQDYLDKLGETRLKIDKENYIKGLELSKDFHNSQLAIINERLNGNMPLQDRLDSIREKTAETEELYKINKQIAEAKGDTAEAERLTAEWKNTAVKLAQEELEAVRDDYQAQENLLQAQLDSATELEDKIRIYKELESVTGGIYDKNIEIANLNGDSTEAEKLAVERQGRMLELEESSLVAIRDFHQVQADILKELLNGNITYEERLDILDTLATEEYNIYDYNRQIAGLKKDIMEQDKLDAEYQSKILEDVKTRLDLEKDRHQSVSDYLDTKINGNYSLADKLAFYDQKKAVVKSIYATEIEKASMGESLEDITEALRLEEELQQRIVGMDVKKLELIRDYHQSNMDLINTELDGNLTLEEKNRLYDKLKMAEELVYRQNKQIAVEQGKMVEADKLEAEWQNRLVELQVIRIELLRDHYKAQAGIINEQLNGSRSDEEKLELYDSLLEKERLVYEQERRIAVIKKDTAEADRLEAEWQNRLVEFARKKAEVYAAQYEAEVSNIRNLQNAVRNEIDFNGGKGTKEQYESLITLNSGLETAVSERLAREEEYLWEIESILGRNSDEYRQQVSVIEECREELAKCREETKGWQKAILQLSVDAINDAISGLKKELDDVNAKLGEKDRIVSAAQAVIQKEIEYQESLRDAVQEQIDALKDANSERERELALMQAKYNLERAMNQKTHLVYEDGQFVYRASDEDIQNARKALDKAEFDATVAELQEQVDYYNEIIEHLNEMGSAWGKVSSNVQQMLDIGFAMSVYGENFAEQILNAQIGVDEFTLSYKGLLSTVEELESINDTWGKFAENIETAIKQMEYGFITSGDAFAEMQKNIRDFYSSFGSSITSTGDGISGALRDIALKLWNDSDFRRGYENYIQVLPDSTNDAVTQTGEILGNLVGISKDSANALDKIIDAIATNIKVTGKDVYSDVSTTGTMIADDVGSTGSKIVSGVSSAGDAANAKVRDSMEEASASLMSGTEEQLGIMNDFRMEMDDTFSRMCDSMVENIDSAVQKITDSIRYVADMISSINKENNRIFKVDTVADQAENLQEAYDKLLESQRLVYEKSREVALLNGDIPAADRLEREFLDSASAIETKKKELEAKLMSGSAVGDDDYSSRLEKEYSKIDASSKSVMEKIQAYDRLIESEMRMYRERESIASLEGNLEEVARLEKECMDIITEIAWKKIEVGSGLDFSSVSGIGVYHDGIKNGYVSDRHMTDDERLAILQDAALKRDEVPAILQRGEVVLNRPQQDYLANALLANKMFDVYMPKKTAASYNTHIPVNAQPVDIRQDITVTLPNVTNNSGIEYLRKELGNLSQKAYQATMMRK